jgi:hypothetical protein
MREPVTSEKLQVDLGLQLAGRVTLAAALPRGLVLVETYHQSYRSVGSWAKSTTRDVGITSM